MSEAKTVRVFVYNSLPKLGYVKTEFDFSENTIARLVNRAAKEGARIFDAEIRIITARWMVRFRGWLLARRKNRLSRIEKRIENLIVRFLNSRSPANVYVTYATSEPMRPVQRMSEFRQLAERVASHAHLFYCTITADGISTGHIADVT